MSDAETNAMDAEANEFALALLMPEHLLRADIARMGGIDLAEDGPIEKLAKRYQVPLAAMALRLSQLLATQE